MSSTRSNCSPFGTSRQAAPMQNRVGALLASPASRRPSARRATTSSWRVDVGLVVRRLRAVRAVLRAAAGLDAEQHAALHLVGRVMRAVHRLRAEHEIRQRRGVDRFDFGDRPVVADVVRRTHNLQSITDGRRTALMTTETSRNSRTDNADRVVGRRRREVRADEANEKSSVKLDARRAFRSTGWYLASVVAVPHR